MGESGRSLAAREKVVEKYRTRVVRQLRVTEARFNLCHPLLCAPYSQSLGPANSMSLSSTRICKNVGEIRSVGDKMRRRFDSVILFVSA